MPLALPVLLCLASGFLLVRLGWSRRTPIVSDYLFRASLSVGFGLAIFSVVFFLSLLFPLTHLILVDLAVFALLLVTNLWRRPRAAAPNVGAVTEKDPAEPAWLPRFLTTAFAIALCAALYSSVLRTLAHPHGDGWDAFSIWNLHARFLFRCGPNWRDGFTPLLPWSHPDYPLLLPAAVAHFWTYLGHDAPAVPAVIGFLFTFSTVALLFSSLSILRGRTPALLGATALLATPSFIEQGTAQYADVPLSFFFLASIALLCLHDDPPQQDHTNNDHANNAQIKTRATPDSSQSSTGLLALAGLAAACAAWTKNEGTLFLCAIVLASLLVLLRRDFSPRSFISAARHLAPLLAAVLPAILLIACFKHFIAPPGDLFSDLTTTLHKLLDPARYWAVLQGYIKGFFRFGRWPIPGTLLLIAFYFAVRKNAAARNITHEVEPGQNNAEQTSERKAPGPQTAIRTSVLALALTLAGYFVVYLITPYDIHWHLRFSLSRLFLQLWPTAILLSFLCGAGTPARGS
jgi:hypothetical protein